MGAPQEDADQIPTPKPAAPTIDATPIAVKLTAEGELQVVDGHHRLAVAQAQA